MGLMKFDFSSETRAFTIIRLVMAVPTNNKFSDRASSQREKAKLDFIHKLKLVGEKEVEAIRALAEWITASAVLDWDLLDSKV